MLFYDKIESEFWIENHYKTSPAIIVDFDIRVRGLLFIKITREVKIMTILNFNLRKNKTPCSGWNKGLFQLIQLLLFTQVHFPPGIEVVELIILQIVNK